MEGEAGEENQSVWCGSSPDLHVSEEPQLVVDEMSLEPIALQDSLRAGGRERNPSAPYCHLLHFWVLPLRSWLICPMARHFM